MKVSPEQLTVVSEDDLKKQGVPEHIAKVRVKHMAEKRSNRMYMLENCIRSGMITQLQHVLTINDSKFQDNEVKKMLTFDLRTIEKDPMLAASYAAQQPVNYMMSDVRIDVPLRENLDPESRLNRQLAKLTYEREKAEKVAKAKEDA